MSRVQGRKRKFRWIKLLRAFHRDAGYLVVGLTFVYALSGLAVNHIQDWDPNFDQIEREHQVALPDTTDEQRIAEAVLRALGRQEKPTDIYRVDEQTVDITLEHSTLHVSTDTGEVLEEGQEARFMLRAANWLHLNRGKQAWTFVADGYAAILLLLATSGLFMMPMRKGLLGRGGVLLIIGVLVPIAYVWFSPLG